ncbi:MAG TPA: hypothetical protein VHP59_15290, partial [Vineibacter terrae]|nr:hypothetical protein [Vineibacter terrae]
MSTMATRGLSAFLCSVALTLAASVAHGQFPTNPTYPQGGGYPPNNGYPQGGGYPPAGGYPQNGGYPQGGPGVIVGTWSTTLYDTRGQAFASIFIQFRP